MFAARGNVRELEVVLIHFLVAVVGGHVLTVDVEHFDFHRVDGLLDDELLAGALGDA